VRTCRNCGLPVAGANDPVRGVAPGRVEMPSAQRSGLSATVGLVLVIGLLLVGGTLAVSGGGLLGSGGRFGAAAETPSPTPVVLTDPLTGESVTPAPSEEPELPKAAGVQFDYTCEDAAIKDLSRGKWRLSEVQAGVRTDDDGTTFDQIYWKLARISKQKQKNPTTVTMQWTTPKAAQERYGIPRVPGTRALVVTFNGPVDISAGQTIDSLQFENEGIDQVRKVQLFEKNGKVRTVIGMRGESCARMAGIGWSKKSNKASSRVELDIERF
jgi:hypothetical protein